MAASSEMALSPPESKEGEEVTAYVDNMLRPARPPGYRGPGTPRWSHLMADSSEELAATARRLGLSSAWLQHAGTPLEHYDVTATVRAKALELGVTPMVYGREGGAYTLWKRAKITQDDARIQEAGAAFKTERGAAVTYSTASPQQAAKAAALLSTELAPFSAANLRALLKSGGFCLLAHKAEVLVGVATALLVDDLADFLPLGQKHLGSEFALPTPAGVLKNSVILPHHRGLGVGKELVRRRLELLKSAGAQSAYCDAWVYPNGSTPAAGPLLAHGFTKLRTEAAFWGKESEALGYSCGQCGSPCSCSAIVFTRLI